MSKVTHCAPFVADWILFDMRQTYCCLDFLLSLSDNNQADVIETFNSASRYLDDLPNIDNLYFEQMVGQIRLNQVNSFDPLDLFITNDIVSSKNYIPRMILSLK